MPGLRQSLDTLHPANGGVSGAGYWRCSQHVRPHSSLAHSTPALVPPSQQPAAL